MNILRFALSYCEQLVKAIIKAGQTMAAAENSEDPLMYSWHDKIYLGAAHGYAGIFYTLMQASNTIYYNSDDFSSNILRLNIFTDILYQVNDPQCKELVERLVRPTIDSLISLRFDSGNFPSSVGSKSDRLVHWCHGAPGWIHMLLQAHKVSSTYMYIR